MKIHNCHIHTFTIDHVPVNFLPFGLGGLMRNRFAGALVRFILINLNPFESRDLFERYANFIKISTHRNQKKVFEVVRGYYPLNTKFVVLPMDMAYMDAGRVPVDIDTQHDELYALHLKYPDQVIHFAAIDPRRGPGIVDTFKQQVEEKGFKGIKLYPPLGYMPNDPNLMAVYEYAEQNSLPIMVHCSKGGVRNKKLSATQAAVMSDPDNYTEIMDRFPKLKICMGHCGGDKEWQRYLDQPWDENSSPRNKSWLSKILNIMKSGQYPNFYADISYTIFKYEENSAVLKVLLQDASVRTQILFGTDFYMVEQEKFPERRLSMSLRALLGDELFTQIAETNPVRYLSTSV